MSQRNTNNNSEKNKLKPVISSNGIKTVSDHCGQLSRSVIPRVYKTDDEERTRIYERQAYMYIGQRVL